jgi:hypothetical protein
MLQQHWNQLGRLNGNGTGQMKNNLRKYFKNIYLFGKSKMVANSQIKQQASNKADTVNMCQKEMDIYGEDRITQQKLYEKWAVKSSWHLNTEAIPLLLSMDPEKYSASSSSDESKQKYEDLREHAQHCVEQGLLPILNHERSADEWIAKPIDVYKWAAISRVEIPVQLSALMEFVMMTLLSTVDIVNDSSNDGSKSEVFFKSDIERILGAALSMLVTYPERCKNKKGQVRAENILSLISENERALFGEEIPKLSATVSIDLINKWMMISISK